MVKDSSYFSEMRSLKKPVEVVVANGAKLTAKYCGDVVLYPTVALSSISNWNLCAAPIDFCNQAWHLKLISYAHKKQKFCHAHF